MIWVEPSNYQITCLGCKTFFFKGDGSERGQVYIEGMSPALPWFLCRINPAKVAYIATTVGFAVCIYDFTVITGIRGADMISVTDYRRCVNDKNNDFALARLPHPDDNAVFGIVKVDPFEPLVGVVQVPQGRLALI